MSADLFAIFGAPDEAPTKDDLEERLFVSQRESTLALDHQGKQSKPSNCDVLFDAEEIDAEAEDDFGDFEDVEGEIEQIFQPVRAQKDAPTLPNVASISQQVDLLDLGNDPASKPRQEHSPIAALEAMNETTTISEADDWGDFEDCPLDAQPVPRSWESTPRSHPSEQAAPCAPTSNVLSSKDDNWDEFDDWNAESAPAQAQATEPSSTQYPPDLHNERRPTNIPPPSTLLQLLPTIFQSLNSQSQSQPSAADIDPLARSIIQVYTVSARLLAGRTLRLQRSRFLQKSLLIGPSTPGSRSGGMKLQSLHTTPSSPLDAALVCDAWASHLHTFTRIVSQSEHRRPWMRLDVNLKVCPGPAGVMHAREECVLCGVRREERVAGVDFEVMDVFVEYWVEGWGHRDCAVWWGRYRGELGQR